MRFEPTTLRDLVSKQGSFCGSALEPHRAATIHFFPVYVSPYICYHVVFVLNSFGQGNFIFIREKSGRGILKVMSVAAMLFN